MCLGLVCRLPMGAAPDGSSSKVIEVTQVNSGIDALCIQDVITLWGAQSPGAFNKCKKTRPFFPGSNKEVSSCQPFLPAGPVTAGPFWDFPSFGHVSFCAWAFSRFILYNCSCLMTWGVCMVGHLFCTTNKVKARRASIPLNEWMLAWF